MSLLEEMKEGYGRLFVYHSTHKLHYGPVDWERRTFCNRKAKWLGSTLRKGHVTCENCKRALRRDNAKL